MAVRMDLSWHAGAVYGLMKNLIPSSLTDADLVATVMHLARGERNATIALIGHLAEFDARRLYLAAGFPSLFAYCTEVLRLSEHAAYHRIEAARAARRFPVILQMLGDGRLNLTTVGLLASHLTVDSRQGLLAAACGRSKREVEQLLAGFFPKPAAPASVCRLPAPKEPPPAMPSTPQPAAPSALDEASVVATTPVPTAGRAVTTSIAPDRYQIRFTASATTYENLRLAQDLLRHAVPDGNIDAIFDRALRALVDELSRQRFAATERARPGRGVRSASRHVAAEVKRAVWQRDRGRCAFRSTSGRLCGTRAFLEFHHVHPYALGGESNVENIELRCRAHNAYEAAFPRGRPAAADTCRGSTAVAAVRVFGPSDAA